MGLFDFFRSKQLSDVLGKTYDIKVQGVKFKVRKIDPVAYMAGYKAMIQPFETYKTNTEKQAALEGLLGQQNKMKEHFSDVFLYSVIEPKLVRKQEESSKGIWVDNLFSDWELANDLYQKIIEITYGKKKMKLFASPKISSSK